MPENAASNQSKMKEEEQLKATYYAKSLCTHRDKIAIGDNR